MRYNISSVTYNTLLIHYNISSVTYNTLLMRYNISSVTYNTLIITCNTRRSFYLYISGCLPMLQLLQFRASYPRRKSFLTPPLSRFTEQIEPRYPQLELFQHENFGSQKAVKSVHCRKVVLF